MDLGWFPMSEEELEKKLKKLEKSYNELQIQFENQNKQITDFLGELNVTSDQISTFLSKKENFSDKNWDEIQKIKKSLDEKLLRELANISNPTKRSKTYSERNIPQHWLFVR